MDPDRLAHDLNRSLVDSLVSHGHIRADGVRAAFYAVQRHHLLPDSNIADVYADRAITLKTAEAGGPLPEGRIISSASMPSLLARVLEQMAVRPGMRVLQVGTGPGYLAALLANMVGQSGGVVSVEIDASLSAAAATNLHRHGYGPAECVVGDGFYGHPPGAPYDRIVATASCFEVPGPWLEQLSDDGTMTLPLSLSQHAGTYPMIWLQKDGFGLRGGVVQGLPRVGFLPLYGPGGVRPVIYEQEISNLEASIQQRLMRDTRDMAQYGALVLTMLLEVAAVVPTAWDSRVRWDAPGIAGRAIAAWRDLGEPDLADYVFRIRNRDARPEAHRWRYDKGDDVLLVSIELRR
jgi:protein-L-isoaspartate(D-aspartate) O-methyltransferase